MNAESEHGSIIYDIDPVAKPRMTQRDKWAKRVPVVKYFAFKDECRLKGVFIPESGSHIIFHIPMPKSWSKKKRERMDGQPHQQRPDKDNLEKALLDAVLDEDCIVWDSRATKLWAAIGCIEIRSHGSPFCFSIQSQVQSVQHR